MLDDFRSNHIIWNNVNVGQFPDVRASSTDENGRKLVVQVMNGSEIENMVGSVLRLAWETPGGHYFGDDVFKLVDPSKGIFELYFTTEMLSHVGRLIARLQLVDRTGSVGSEPFNIEVFKGINTEGIQSSNSFSALETAMGKIANIDGLIGMSGTQQGDLMAKYSELELELGRVEREHSALLASEKRSSSELLTKVEALEVEMVEVKKKLSSVHDRYGGQPHHLRVATFNVFLGMVDYPKYRRFMMENRIDIAGVQEARKSHIPYKDIYNFSHISFAENKDASGKGYGNLIQANMAHRNLKKMVIPVGDVSAGQRLVNVTISAYGKDISVYSYHADSHDGNEIRFAQFAEIRRIMEADKTPYKILLGDFNVQDVAHYDLLGDLKSAQGFGGDYFETWNLSQGPWGTGNIDNIMVSPNIEIMRVVMHGDVMGSDHNPLWADVHLH